LNCICKGKQIPNLTFGQLSKVSVGKSSPLWSPSQSLLIGPFRIRVSAQAAANRLVFTNFKKSFLELFRATVRRIHPQPTPYPTKSYPPSASKDVHISLLEFGFENHNQSEMGSEIQAIIGHFVKHGAHTRNFRLFYHILHILGIGLPPVQSREAIESPLDELVHPSADFKAGPQR
jgi:hypothetical protein